MAIFGNIGNVLKGGVQKIGNALGKAPQKLPNIDVDNLTFDPAKKPLPNIDDLTFDPNKAPTNIDDLTFEDMLSGKESQPKKTGQDGFANALSGVGSNYQVTPSRVDYSQFMGLSPETQRYLYGGM
jgi:hypothetical protein